MKELVIIVLISILAFKISKLEDQTKLTKEQNELLITYCMAMPECKKEMEK